MLSNLHIKNLALIEEAEIEFYEGLNILTGETGAGKSIILGSIGLAMGGKIPKDILRDPEKPGLVELTFEIRDEKVAEQLSNYDIEPEEHQVIFSRRIRDGKSTQKINGETVPLSVCREIGALLLDVHGQHDHEFLRKPVRHRDLLDAYAGTGLREVKQRAALAYDEWQRRESELASFHLDEEKRLREMDLCRYEIDEIQDARLKPGEDLELESVYKKCSNARRISEGLGAVLNELEGTSSEGASGAISRAVRVCGQLLSLDGDLNGIYTQLMELDSACTEIIRDTRDYAEEMTFDQSRMAEVEKRLDLIYRLKSKYGNSIDKIRAYCEEKQERLEQLEHYEQNKSRAAAALEQAKKEWLQEAEELSALRKKYAKELDREVTEELLGLNFLQVRFQTSFQEAEHPGREGIDQVEFLISTNPGEPVRPLQKIASGGELSRIMLGMKTLMAGQDGVDALIFDEIDAGISGRTAQMVGEKMSVVAKKHQILCITHLPQIAAMADHHFYIEKTVEEGKTVTKIAELSEEESVSELARMLGGARITESVMENAKEMKGLARQKKVM